MKKYLIIIILFIGNWSLATAFGQGNGELTSNKISEAIRKGNYSELAKYFNTSIDLTIPDNEGTYSDSQSEMIMKDFFSKNKPKSFSIKDKGNSSPVDEYVIGELVATKTTFRTYWLLKNISGKYYIQQLKFENN